MGRLTEYVTENCSKPFYRFRSDGEIDIRYRYCINIEKAIDKLAEYENTGLEPKEVEQLKHDLAVRDKALELAVKDKIKYENVLLEEFAGMGAKPALRKKEQFYLEQAEKELKGEK